MDMPAEIPIRRGKLIKRCWDPQMAALGGRRARGGFLYEAYIPSEIAEGRFQLEADIAGAAANAELATRELNQKPPKLANFEALARQLLRAESVASSRIEGLVLSHRRLAKADFSREQHDITARGVLANMHALECAIELASEANEIRRDNLLAVHRILFEGTRDEHLGGRIREEQSWIGGAASSPRNAEFVPPPPELRTRVCSTTSAHFAIARTYPPQFRELSLTSSSRRSIPSLTEMAASVER